MEAQRSTNRVEAVLKLQAHDDNHGIEFLAADGSTHHMIVADGEVGIGTSNPKKLLHAKGTGSTDAWLRIEPGNWSAEGDYATLEFGKNGEHYIRGEHTAGTTLYDIDKFQFLGGNVGIGTDDPGEKLEVDGGAKIHKTRIGTVTQSDGNKWIRDSILYGNYGNGFWWDETDEKWKREADADPTHYGYNDFGGIVFKPNQMDFIKGEKGGTVEWTNDELYDEFIHLSITNDGNIGIGTTEPLEKLEVIGNVKVDGNIDATTDIIASGNIEAVGNIKAATIESTTTIDATGDITADNIEASGTIKASKFDGAVSWSTADYDSGWLPFQSQNGSNSYMQLAHNLGDYPGRVKVLVKAIDGDNQDFIFEGMGCAQNDDDTGSQYGGVIFGYSDQHVRLWAPDQNNHSDLGRIIFIGDGWGGGKKQQNSDLADVRVLAWL